MILDTVDNAARYDTVHPLFARAFEYFAETDWAGMPVGKNEIAGDDLFVNVIRAECPGADKSPLEAHRKYIDIHVTLSGLDSVGWKPIDACVEVVKEFDEAADVALYKDAPACYVTVAAGSFVVVFPEDAHAPMACDGFVEKVVFKIALDT